MRQHFARDLIVGCAYLVLIAALVVVSVMAYRKDFTSTMPAPNCRTVRTSKYAASSSGR
jgi:hypothetical protein